MLGGVMNATLFILLVVNLSGCAGYYRSRSSGPVEKDLSSALLRVPEDEQKLWKRQEVKFYNDERALPAEVSPGDQKERQEVSVDKETRIYSEKRTWCGLTIWVGFPIPLWLPSCRTYTELTFENGVPISAREQYVEGSGRICGPFVPLLGISKSPSAAGFCGRIELVDPPVKPGNSPVRRK